MAMGRYKIEYEIDTHDSDGPSICSFYVEADSDKYARNQAFGKVEGIINRIRKGGSAGRAHVTKIYRVNETLEDITNKST